MVGCLFCSGVNGDSPWAAAAGEAAVNMLECSLGSKTAQVPLRLGALLPVCDWDAAARGLSVNTDVWTDHSLVLDEISGAASAGVRGLCSVYVLMLGEVADGGILMNLVLLLDGSAASCRGFCSLTWSLADCSEG